MAEPHTRRSGAQVLRMCRVCRHQHPKSQLVRWVQGPAGFERDDAQSRPGRGYYTDSPDCADKLTKMKVKR